MSLKEESVFLEDPETKDACGKRTALSSGRGRRLKSFPAGAPFNLKNASLSIKLFASFLLCLAALNYGGLLESIWLDSRWSVSQIVENYRSIETVELLEHTFKYLPWFLIMFGFAHGLLLASSYPEPVKRFFSVLIPLAIASDIGSMWLIRWLPFFGWQLFVSGATLAACFLALFLLIQFELWIRKAS